MLGLMVFMADYEYGPGPSLTPQLYINFFLSDAICSYIQTNCYGLAFESGLAESRMKLIRSSGA